MIDLLMKASCGILILNILKKNNAKEKVNITNYLKFIGNHSFLFKAFPLLGENFIQT